MLSAVPTWPPRVATAMAGQGRSCRAQCPQAHRARRPPQRDKRDAHYSHSTPSAVCTSVPTTAMPATPSAVPARPGYRLDRR